ncbi:MAG: dienelactone hydrolase family protein [Planctomycetota bacterium]|nr:dienelactone hydrolase family protein [Planctomycetota bacterium]MDA1106594.1 dienelactone hydrolase family protein [Planctomycetota bacterium]
MPSHHESRLTYHAGSLECEGFVSRPVVGTGVSATAATAGSSPGSHPVVLVCHAWAGEDGFANEKARSLTAQGFIGFAVDVYGKGRRGSSNDENMALMSPLVDDRALLRARLGAAVTTAAAIPGADATRIAAIGYCFGGLCALDIARACLPGVRGVVSFHGLFSPPDASQVGPQRPIAAKVLALHGWDDPMATPESVLGFAREMSAAKANWELDAYGGTMHAFTNPQANNPGFGTVYSAQADARSWARAIQFLGEVFA